MMLAKHHIVWLILIETIAAAPAAAMADASYEELWDASVRAQTAGEFETAERMLGNAIAVAPTPKARASARYRMARLHEAQGHGQRAVLAYRAFLAESDGLAGPVIAATRSQARARIVQLERAGAPGASPTNTVHAEHQKGSAVVGNGNHVETTLIEGGGMSAADVAAVSLFALGGAALLAGIATGSFATDREGKLDAECANSTCPVGVRGVYAEARDLVLATNLLWVGAAVSICIATTALLIQLVTGTHNKRAANLRPGTWTF